MKKSDIAMIIFIASVSLLVAYFVGKAVFGDVYTGTARVKTIDLINPAVDEPDPAIFNKSAINPAVQVEVTGTDTKADDGSIGGKTQANDNPSSD